MPSREALYRQELPVAVMNEKLKEMLLSADERNEVTESTKS